VNINMPKLADIPEGIRVDAYLRAMDGDAVHWVTYTPAQECFFQGDDPFATIRQTPHVLWGRITPREPWPHLAELNVYRCVLEFQLLTSATHEKLAECYRDVADQVGIMAVDPWSVAIPQGDPGSGPVHEDFVAQALLHLEAGNLAALQQAGQTLLHLSHPELWISSALRWLLLLLDSMPDKRNVLRSLIESLRTLRSPDWAAA
jgi:two-component system chemotaxis sensor kinase CheA